MRNHLNQLIPFLMRWADPSLARPTGGIQFAIGIHGNINEDGGTTTLVAPTLVRWDEDFETVLEPGVRYLVRHLIDKLDCVTYSSCEGHPALTDQSTFRPRHVGILPRTVAERKVLLFILRHLATSTNAHLEDSAVRIEVEISLLTSERAPVPCLDLQFVKCTGTEMEYFSDCDQATSFLIQKISSL